nr:kinetochore protein SPC25 homolog [Ipomoea batatas]
MESPVGATVRAQMEELRLKCAGEIPIMQRRIDSVTATFQKSLDSNKSKAQETVQLQGKLAKLKAELREVEDGLVKALAVKTRKEAKRIAITDSLSVTKARIEELKGVVEDHRARRDEYAAIISEQSNALKACEEKRNQNSEHRDEIEEAILWYNRVLGFRVECGSGVKFIFTNINMKDPHEEYSFTVRHENDSYTLLDCDPHLNDIKELLTELNKSNGLFKFVRTMREKFQEAALYGNLPKVTSQDQDTSTISVSAPVCSVSTDCGSESPSKQRGPQAEEFNRNSKKLRHGKGGRSGLLSPGSASSLRRSPRFKVTIVKHPDFNNKSMSLCHVKSPTLKI